MFLCFWVGLLASLAGCNSLLNAWLDPTVVGSFAKNRTLEIRTALTLEDTPFGIPGAEYPRLEDLDPQICEYPITAGDTLAIEINELRQRQVPFQAEAQVASTGYVNLPVVGRISAVGMTVPEFEGALVMRLRERSVLRAPEVVVNALFLQKATYSVFGIGVSASTNAPLRAGVFPIRRPDLRLLEAINQVGGLNEFVTEVFVFRGDSPCSAPPEPGAPYEPAGQSPTMRDRDEPDVSVPAPTGAGDAPPSPEGSDQASAERELLDAVVDAGQGGQEERPEYGQEGYREQRELVDSVEADPSRPYLWINGEFVPNSAHEGAAAVAETTGATPRALGPIAPAVNWSRIAGDVTYRVIRVPADALRDGDPEVNINVRAGDVIRIVSGEIGVYYVMGQVNRVGPFAFNAEQITLKTAIATAGGLSGLAWPSRCTVYRRIGQREQMIQVNLDRIFAGKDADFHIRRGDIINVGTHPFAPFLQRIRGLTLPNPTTTVGYGFTYVRNFADIDSFAVKQNPSNRPRQFPNLFP